MNKLRNLATIICTLCLFALPTSGFAKMTLMTDAELDQITAQAGFSDMLGIVNVNQDGETGTYYFGGSGGYVSLADTSYQGTTGIDPSLITNIEDANGTTTGVECTLNGPVVDVSHLQTSVRLGQDIANGSHLGTFYIDRMIVSAHGKLRVTSR